MLLLVDGKNVSDVYE